MKFTLSNQLPDPPVFVEGIRRAPDRGYKLSPAQTKTALKNALRYIPRELHAQLAPEFMNELLTRGKIYGYRFRPEGDLKAKPIDEYKGKCIEGKAFQVMIDNNLSFDIALYPYELVTYGETGQVCQNWMQYRLIKMYLEELTQDQTLVVESGHPLGLFKSKPEAPRVIITNSMMVGLFDNQKDWEIAAQMGVANYGQMTAGGWMYIGPQGIVHGTFNTLLNAGRMKLGIPQNGDLRGHLFISSGLGGMSGAQPKAAEMSGAASIIAEVDMSRIENGKIELTEEDFNLAELVDNLIAMTRSEIEAHHHDFEVQLNKIEHEYVRGDSLRVQQIFTNIMSNAIKYTPDGGKILFSITEKPTTSLDIGCYEFVIQDNGMGMSEEFQKVMFDPFTREDDKRISEIQGTGLGMAITRNIVNMMNGNIKVESKLGKGSRFTVTIFLRLRDEKSETIDELINLPVLVVDDDKIGCEGTVATLNEIGIDGEWVLSGKEAVERAVKRHENGNDYFVYIIDWQMPGMDGIETTRQIRQKIGPDVSVIVLTSYDYTKIEEEAKAAGVDEFISKPLFRSRLTAALQKIISGKPSQDARDYLKNIAASDYTGKKILLVEDNELNREVAAEIIGMTGAEIETAVNGKEAVDKVADHPNGYYDLVFMDVQMPIMNGYEAATAIRSLPKHKGELLPIVAMTANAFTEDVILAKSAGMNEHIAKPLDMEKLNRMLHEWM